MKNILRHDSGERVRPAFLIFLVFHVQISVVPSSRAWNARLSPRLTSSRDLLMHPISIMVFACLRCISLDCVELLDPTFPWGFHPHLMNLSGFFGEQRNSASVGSAWRNWMTSGWCFQAGDHIPLTTASGKIVSTI